MLERDYIMRLIRQFFEFLTKLLELKKKNKGNEAQVYLFDMYDKFLKHPATYYYGLDSDEIIYSFDEEHREYYVEMLAELLYQDALMKDNDRELLQKSSALFEYANRHSSSFSFTRFQRIEEIKQLTEPSL